MARILVTGGAGDLGRAVVARLVATGNAVRVFSRRTGAVSGAETVRGDLATGAGLAEAVAGVETVIHAATAPFHTRQVDEEGTRRLVTAAEAAGARHLIYVSIVGIDRNPYSYYQAKLVAEAAVRAGGVPWTILRATQFHGFVPRIVDAQARLPVVLIPRGWQFQVVDIGEVAARLVALAGGTARREIMDMGGPQARRSEALARDYVRAAGIRKPVIALPVPGPAARAFREGRNLTPEHAEGVVTWDAYLRERFGTTQRTGDTGHHEGKDHVGAV